MPSSNSLLWTPDVLVSYENKDDKVKRFTSILFKKLKQAGIGSRDPREGKDDLFIAIREARFALVVFSVNYASSKQCLDNLVEILLHRGISKYPSLVVIPIFHGVQPAEVRQNLNEAYVKEKEWRRALAKVEEIPGYDLKKDAQGDDSTLVDKIVQHLFNEIWSLYSHKVFGPFGGNGKQSWHSDEINGIHVVYTGIVRSLTFKVCDNTGCNPMTSGNTYEVKLHEGEDIICFHGNFQEAEGIQFKALRFRTTRRRDLGVGRICKEEKGYFSVPVPSGAGEVIEFFGSKSKDGLLKSIGARVGLTRDVPCPVGLFGGRRGVSWDTEQHTTVKGIRALCDSSGNGCIRSIAFRFDNDEWWWPPPDSDKKWHMEFKIDDPDEYLSSISGYYTYDGITSLTFFTNKRSTTTIGDGKGTRFSSPETDYQIVGFYGWSDKDFLYGIGAYFKQISNLRPVKSIGPFGGPIDWDDRKFKGVKEIRIYKPDDFCYIKILYVDDSGKYCPIIHGDHTKEFPGDEEKIELTYPTEYLTWISGYTRDDGTIQSLTVHSNRKKKRFGAPKERDWEHFGYPSNTSQIIGFYGTFGKTLNSIGVYEKPIENWKPLRHEPSGFIRSGGDYWDDGGRYNVVGYRVTERGSSNESKKIESITFMYENNGSLVEGSRRGGGDPSSGDWVMLNYPEERLGRIRGYWCNDDAETIIHNLKIVTTDNEWTYAERKELNLELETEPESESESESMPKPKSKTKPKPKPKPKPKTEPKSKSKRFTILKRSKVGRRMVGFFGYAKTCLNFIGAHLEP